MAKQKQKKLRSKTVSTKVGLSKKYHVWIATGIGMVLFLFLFFNIVSSQLFSPLYSGLSNEEKPAVISYLKKIRYLPEFNSELKKHKYIYGNSIEEEVFSEEWQRKKLINKLEQLLEKNPKARDVLYELSQLYKQEHNQQKFEEYVKRAKEVDPML